MKPRVLMVIPQFRPMASGAEHHAERLAKNLVRLGVEVGVLTGQGQGHAPAREVAEGVRIHRAPFALSYTLDDDYVYLFRHLVQNRNTYDILHCHMLWGHAVVATVVARWFGKKVAVKPACNGEYGELACFSRFKRSGWGLRVLRQADALVALSTDMEKELLAWGFYPDRVRLIPNGVDLSLFRSATPLRPQKPARFILVGRRLPQKGIDTTLMAVKILLDRGFSSRFTVDFLGWDYPEADYRAMARELGVDKAARFLPYCNDIAGAYRAAHCLLLPSRAEGLSNVLLEAMACGLAVIGTPVSGTRDVVTDNVDGVLVKPGDPEALALAMERLILDPARRQSLGKNARQRVEQAFSLDNVTQKYFNLYKDLLAK